MSLATLPQFNSPNNISLYELGEKKNRAELQQQLEKFKDYSVTDATSDNHLKKITHTIDSEVDRCTLYGLCHITVKGRKNNDSALLCQLLSMGVDPNVKTHGRDQPLHFCGEYGIWKSAQVLLDCRATQSADNRHGDTPLAIARRNHNEAKSGEMPVSRH
jgi:hypothetical protein